MTFGWLCAEKQTLTPLLLMIVLITWLLGSTASNPAQSCASDNQSATATTPSQAATSTATLTSPVDAVAQAQSTEVTSEDPLSSPVSDRNDCEQSFHCYCTVTHFIQSLGYNTVSLCHRIRVGRADGNAFGAS